MSLSNRLEKINKALKQKGNIDTNTDMTAQQRRERIDELIIKDIASRPQWYLTQLEEITTGDDDVKNISSRLKKLEDAIKSGQGKKIKSLEYVLDGEDCPPEKRYITLRNDGKKLEDVLED